jgi:hypothetical protein
VIRGAVTVGAVVACALAATLGAAARPAPTPTSWTKLPQGPPLESAEAALARTRDGTLHVVYPGRTQDLWHETILVAGAVGSATPVVSGWASVENPALVVAPDGTLRTFWGGIASTDPKNTNDALNTASAPASGAPWTLQPGRVSSDPSAFLSPTAAATTKDGGTVEVTTSTFGMTFHFGLTPATPTTKLAGGCCYYDPGVAVDAATGETVLGWYSNESGAQGMALQAIAPPGVVGARSLAPGSASADGKSAVAPLDRTPVVARIGAPGVFLAYGVGYPTFSKVALLRFGDATPAIRVAAQDPRAIRLAAAPGGRLWIFWKGDTTIFATRTNRAATRIEPLSVVAPPQGTDTVWQLDGEGSLGPLDLVANVQTADAAFWYRRILARLSLHGSALGNGLARFVVTDAGDPLDGVKVRLRGRSGTTSAGGVVTLRVAPGAATATASKAGYAPAAVRVRVR